MNMPNMISAILAVCAFGIFLPSALAAATENKSSDVTNAQIENLQREIRALQEQLEELGSTKDTAAKQRLMQDNWQSMLEYMQGMQAMPWMMGEPGDRESHMMGRGMMGRGMMGWRRQGDWMMGCPMVGGPDSGWALPPDVDPEQYREEMLENMQRMHDQMAQIRSTKDPAERERLLQKHWRDMYRNMQTMRGMGWMWGGTMPGGQSAAQLPEPTSTGAKLVSRYCTQCHAQPSPQLHTAAEWQAVASRMKINMKNLKKANWNGVKIPSDAEMKSIVGYLQKHAR